MRKKHILQQIRPGFMHKGGTEGVTEEGLQIWEKRTVCSKRHLEEASIINTLKALIERHEKRG